MISLGPVDRFVAGAIGEPGERTFLIEVEGAGQPHWFLLEKQQVAVLADRVLELLRDAGYESSGAPRLSLREPDAVDFRVGEIRMAYSSVESLVTVTLIPVAGDEEREEDDGVEFDVSTDQLHAMAVHAREAVIAGRPACPRCALPMDPDGHVCPASNGDLRRHRP